MSNGAAESAAGGADAAARLEALDPARSFIVQAPAGSGKTELLTQRFLRLLATVESPEQIIAITFTRKAAAEMRSRILRALESAAGPPPEATHKRVTWELARAAGLADAARGWSLKEHPARLRIQTIDALNALLARRLPILSAAGAPLEPTEDARPLYEAACKRLIERLGEDQPELRALEALITHLGARVEGLIELLSDMLARRDQWLHQVISARSLDDLRGTLEATLRALIEHHLQRLSETLGEARARELLTLAQFAAGNLLADPKRGAKRRALLEACVGFAGELDGRSACLPVWRTIAGMLLKTNGEALQSFDSRHGFPRAHPMRGRMQRVLEELREDPALIEQMRVTLTLPEPQYSAEQWRIVEALLEALPLAVSELQLVFQREGKGDYVEAALRALHALGASGEPTDLALAFDYRLHHILVDEFQDTSFTQLDLLERLTEGWTPGDGRTLFCVGDPMQSIYRFRQADVGLFLQLQAQGLRNVPLTPLTLSANFRSTRPVVAWLNRVFPAAFAARNEAESGAVAYSPSQAASSSEAGGVYVHPALHADELAEARRVVALVRAALERDPASTAAVLVSARTHVAALARELASAGVEYQAVEIELLSERPVVQDLMALTRALVHLADRAAWLAVLRAPWCGMSLADLHALAAHDSSQTIRALLERSLNPSARPVRDKRSKPVDVRQLVLALPDDASAAAQLSADGRRRAARAFAAIEAALAERGRWPLREWVERAWNALHGPAALERPRDLEDAEAFFSRLEQIENAGDLDDVAQLDQRLERLFAKPRAAERARVEVMTIHKAKGLEFDTVILPSLHRGTRGEQPDLLRWARVVGPLGGMVLAPVKASGAPPDPIYQWIERLEKERARRERVRLLYVAATRARRELHLLGAAGVEQIEGRLQITPPRPGTMLAMLWPELQPFFEAAAATCAAPQPAAPEAPRPELLRRLPIEWSPPAPDAAVAAPPALETVDLQRPEFDWVSEVSRRVGTLVHRELDRMTSGLAAQTRFAESKPRLLAELAELGVPPDRRLEACERAIAAIERTLSDPRGRWLLGLGASLREAESELALSGFVNGELVNGVIDRTFIDERGVRWIVDFKTSTHAGGNLEAFLDQEVERYQPQLARYAQLLRLLHPGEPVKAALYFPLMQQWREVQA